MKRKIIFLFLFMSCCLVESSFAQLLQVLDSGRQVSLRGLSAVNDRVVWVSGTRGTVGLSTNGGNSWKWMQVKGMEERDFRDIEAFDGATAVIMAIGEPAYILKTTNGGKTWRVVFEDSSKGMFLDAMEFWNEQSGIVVGDPIDGKIFIARTFDEGESWKKLPPANYPRAEPGEAMFAASGTNIRKADRDEAYFVTGGMKSRLFLRDQKIELPLAQGNESSGANSLTVWDNRKLNGGQIIYVVGGDFARDTARAGNSAYSLDGGRSWQIPRVPPFGYRSCVEYITEKRMVTCGLNGTDISTDGGETWKSLSRLGFHVCRKAKEGKTVFLAGPRGRIAKLVWK